MIFLFKEWVTGTFRRDNKPWSKIEKRKMDFIAKKEGGDVKPETEDTIVIRVCDSVRKLE